VRYFREVDTNLMHLIGGDSAPMVLAGVERNVGLYRQVSSYKSILDGFIEENPELDNPKHLHAAALAIVEPYFRETERIARQQFEKLGGTPRVSTDPAEIVTAAENGRIDSLFLIPGLQLWGRFDPTQNATELHNQRQDGDSELASLAAEQTFLNGGAVFFCDKNQTPRKTPIAALLRY
jgi:Bacterial archaeo-eukaryotic release factor family 3